MAHLEGPVENRRITSEEYARYPDILAALLKQGLNVQKVTIMGEGAGAFLELLKVTLDYEGEIWPPLPEEPKEELPTPSEEEEEEVEEEVKESDSPLEKIRKSAKRTIPKYKRK